MKLAKRLHSEDSTATGHWISAHDTAASYSLDMRLTHSHTCSGEGGKFGTKNRSGSTGVIICNAPSARNQQHHSRSDLHGGVPWRGRAGGQGQRLRHNTPLRINVHMPCYTWPDHTSHNVAPSHPCSFYRLVFTALHEGLRCCLCIAMYYPQQEWVACILSCNPICIQTPTNHSEALVITHADNRTCPTVGNLMKLDTSFWRLP